MANKKREGTKPKYRDRIKEVIKVKGGDVLASPFNWRKHPDQQRTALTAVLSEIGIAGVPICYRGDDGKLYAVDGHCRLHDVGANEEWTVAVLDITEAEAKKLITVFDPISELAEADPGQLQALLGEVSFDDLSLSDFMKDLAIDNGVVLPSEFDGDVGTLFNPDTGDGNDADSDTPTSITEPLPTTNTCPKCGYEW